jgi:predicted AAA+ superfamily ATPase
MAVQLKTFCDYVTDSGLCSMELFYVRDRQKHETDFLLVQNGIPAMLIEAKLTEDSLDRNLKFFSSKLPDARCIQVVKKSGIFKKISKSIWILSVNRFFNMLWNYSQPL